MGTISTLIFYLLTFVVSSLAQPGDLVIVEEYAIGSFQRATRIIAGTNGSIFVIDADRNSLFVFSDGLKSTSNVGGFGWASGSFDGPTGIATDGVNIYVSDYGNHRIQRFDRKLNYISSLSTRDTSDITRRFGYPLDIALSEFGDLFVLDGENLRVLKFTPSYFFERSFGDVNAGKGKLQNPVKLIATTSRIYVGERNRIVVFDYFGNYLGSVGEGIVFDFNGFTLIPEGFIAASNENLWLFSKDGVFIKTIPLNYLITDEKIERIQDIAFSENRVFILAQHRFHVFKLIE